MRWLTVALAITALLWAACDEGSDHTAPSTDTAGDVWSPDSGKADDPWPPADTYSGEEDINVSPDTSTPAEECPPSTLDGSEVCVPDNCILEQVYHPDGCWWRCYKYIQGSSEMRSIWTMTYQAAEEYCL